MKILLLGFLFFSFVLKANDTLVPVVEIPDSINPGTADYLISQIENAERQKSPLLLLRMDTPGGLLSSTREIIQRMLNSPVLIVVFIGPQGAHAGSAGALITLASDVAVMAPSTNIGAAHPVTGNGSDMDKTMAQKVTNDTAAFAEGVAKSKGRNAVWAVKAVKDSASITSEEALKEGVIDFIANDISEIFKKLPGFKLKKAKKYGLNTFESVPTLTFTSRAATMTIKQKLLAFFSDPNLSYLIMSLGGLCLWIELSHPGLILPGVVGVFCLLISMVSFQMLPVSYGALALILIGMAMVIAEFYVTSYGVLGVGGIICFVVGSLFLIDSDSPEYQIKLSLILPIATVLSLAALFIGSLVYRSRRVVPRSGSEALVGQYSEVFETVTAESGKVFLQGEIWNAVCAPGQSYAKGTVVRVLEVKGLTLTVAAS